MFRREMGSKRGSLPPKEGDLTCMPLRPLRSFCIFVAERSQSSCSVCLTGA